MVEEKPNTAESEHCTVVTTKVKRGREIIMSMIGDWDVLCFESDHIVYDLAICDADGILLEKPSARTKVGIEITKKFLKG